MPIVLNFSKENIANDYIRISYNCKFVGKNVGNFIFLHLKTQS